MADRPEMFGSTRGFPGMADNARILHSICRKIFFSGFFCGGGATVPPAPISPILLLNCVCVLLCWNTLRLVVSASAKKRSLMNCEWCRLSTKSQHRYVILCFFHILVANSQQSVAALTTCCQVSLSLAFLHDVWSPKVLRLNNVNILILNLN